MSKKLVSNIPIAQEILQVSKAKCLKHVVISPGSRNAPLTISFSNDSFFKCYSIVDERCAAFFALGIAQQTKKPVALVCTSGSALLNYYPAIAEAFYSDIPLVILSADRPKERIDIGDGQTIRQEGVFKNHILQEANLKNSAETYTDSISNENIKNIAATIDTSIQLKGPVHINIPLYEPLYNTIEEEVIANEGITNLLPLDVLASDYIFPDELKSIWTTSKKKLILVGVLSPGEISSTVLDELLNDPSIILLTETTSNLHHSKLIPSIDQLIAKLTDEEFELLRPELLVTFGGLIVSKKVKAFLREYSPNSHWHINTKKAYNTFNCLTEHIKIAPNLFFKALNDLDTDLISTNYQSYWLSQHQQRLLGHDNYLETIPYSDLLVFKKIVDKLPKVAHLQLSNSSTIRYAQLFSLPKEVDIFCNRGTSGIDGSTSTAIGAATIHKKQPILITGDLSFFYDSNALWNNYIPNNFKIIVINNNGGGIFRILPGNKSADYFTTFLETTHTLKADKLAEMYGFKYHYTSGEDLDQKLESFFKEKDKQILEIHTPRLVNDTVLLNYFSKIR